MITTEQVISQAREYIGTPFHHQGRLRNVGVDCLGLPVCVCRDLSLPYKDVTTYGRRPDGKSIELVLDSIWERIEVKEARKGCVLVFWILNPKLPQHACFLSSDLGWYGPGRIIHTHDGVGEVVECVLSESWKKRLAFAYHIPGVG